MTRVRTATDDPLVGRTLEGRYRILDRIARGGMSTVYSAVDERLDRLVAVKVMSAALSADPAFKDRFTREARAAARLTHLNTVSVFDQGVDQDDSGRQHVFLVMELVSGRTLRDLIRERGRLEPAEAVSIMEPVLSALSAAHRAGIVHRDVKPENILLSDEGIVKVADFGLARAVESDPSATRTGLMMGTVAYCAPEQISKGQADQRSDVYAAGVVLFELLTGAPPFQGESAMNVAYQHVHSRVPAPSSRVKGIPSELDELVIEATDSDPDARPADAGAFLAELADLRADLALPVVAIPPRPRAHGPGANGVRPDGQSGGRDAFTSATTNLLGHSGAGRHDTSVVPREPRTDSGPPPPIVTPPPHKPPRKQRAPLSPRARRRRRALVTLLVFVLLGAGAGYGGWWFAAGRYGRVPNVVAETHSAAIHDLRSAGYQVSSAVTTQYSESIPAGEIIATNPGVGSRLPHGRTISLVVSKGPERYTIPSVVNKTAAAARTALKAIPVQVAAQVSTTPSDSIKKGLVVGTDPAAGQRVKKGQAVTIIVSSGPPIVNIPTLGPNTAVGDEEQALHALLFKTVRTDAYSTSVQAGDVISINPTGSAPKGSTITLTVSKGPQIVTVPDIPGGTPLADAEAALRQVGLNYTVATFNGHGSAVLTTNPPAGTKVQAGSTITIYAI
jgi:serine/threonine protein kinase